MIDQAIEQLVQYGIDKTLIPQADAAYTRNRLLEILRLPGAGVGGKPQPCADVYQLLHTLVSDACARKLIPDTQGSREQFDASADLRGANFVIAEDPTDFGDPIIFTRSAAT